jgi:hypothetical protein
MPQRDAREAPFRPVVPEIADIGQYFPRLDRAP